MLGEFAAQDLLEIPGEKLTNFQQARHTVFVYSFLWLRSYLHRRLLVATSEDFIVRLFAGL